MKPRRQIVSALFLGAMTLFVSGCNSDSTSPDNGGDASPPAAPSNMHAHFDASTHRDWLAWDASATPSVTSYDVYYSDSPSGTGDLLTTVDAGSTAYLLPVAFETSVEYYRVRAINDNGAPSQFTPVIEVQRSVWTSVPPPSDPGDADPTKE